MWKWNVVVYFDKSPLVIIQGEGPMHVYALLDWYAEVYAFERSRLTGITIDNVVQCDAKLWGHDGKLYYK